MNGDTLATPGPLAAQARPIDDHNWVHLDPGDRVTATGNGFEPNHGTVDNVSEDATYFWVWINGPSRILIFHGDGTVTYGFLS
jgi:hypothetical protein